MENKKRWTLDAGRTLLRNGIPVVTIHPVVFNGRSSMPYTEVDDLAIQITALLNLTKNREGK
jgi:hypothetical protein